MNVSLYDGVEFSSNATVNFTIDSTKPNLNSSLNISSPYFGQSVNFTGNVSDNLGLSWCQIIINQSNGAKQYFNKTLSGTSDQCSQNFTIFKTRGAIINFSMIVNDSINNINQTSFLVTVANTPPGAPAILFPTSDLKSTNTANLSLNVTFLPDSDSDPVIVYYYINGIINQTSPVNTTLNASEGRYILNVSLYDGIDFSSNATVNFTLDRSAPTVAIYSPANTTNLTSQFVTFSWNTTDNIDNVILCNLTVDGSVLNSNAQSANNSITTSSSTLNEGNHNWSTTCFDSTGNSNISKVFFFGVFVTKTVISVQTKNDSYKQFKEVNLTSSISWDSADLETRKQSTTKDIVFFNSTFNTDAEGWNYVDDLYQGTSNPGGVDGQYVTSGAGCLGVGNCLFVNIDFGITGPTSGGWNNSYVLPSYARVSHRFFFNYTQEGTPDPAEDSAIYTRNTSTSSDVLVNTYDGNTPNPPPYVYRNGFYSYNVTLNPGTYNFDVGAWMADTTANDEDTWAWIDNIEIIAYSVIQDNEGSSPFVYYNNTNGPNFTKISDIDVAVEVSYFNASGSVNASNKMPDLEVQLYNGSNFSYSYYCNLTLQYGIGGNYTYNCTHKIVDPLILKAWNNSNNRALRIRGINIDNENSENDTINWTGVFVEIKTPSKFENYGSQNISGTLLIQVLNTSGMPVFTAYNQTVIVENNSKLNLSQLWNANPWNTGYNVLGTYTIYAALLNSSYGVKQNFDGTYANDTYSFKVDYLRIVPQSPLNNSVKESTGFFANLTLSYNSFPSSGYCEYSIDPNSRMLAINSSLIGDYTESGGDYKNVTLADNRSFWFVGNQNFDIGSYFVNSSSEIVYDIGEFIRKEYIRNITLSLTYCHSGNSPPDVKCDGVAPTGTVENDQNVSIYNFSSLKWVSLGNLRANSNGLELSDIFYPNGTLSNYVNSSDNKIKIRI